MTAKIRPFLMFEGRAEEALNFYISLFPNSAIADLHRYGPGQMGKEGSVYQARFTIGGQTLMCIDSPVKHGFSFTPSFSLFVEVDSEAELRRVFAALSEGGIVRMPLNNYGFSRLFGWTDDRFGVSWQVNWA